MRKLFLTISLFVTLGCCSNTPELESGEIKTWQLLKQSFEKSNGSKIFVDSRNLLSRDQIDTMDIPILFVELESGQNGTLTLYPGQGVGQTWLAADGATITLDRGVIKASRGMGNDIMGSVSSMPSWPNIKDKEIKYRRKMSYITGNNKIFHRLFECSLKKSKKTELLEIWDIEFWAIKFQETCDSNGFQFRNIYYVDNADIVRRSVQYHSDTIGYITTERLDR